MCDTCGCALTKEVPGGELGRLHEHRLEIQLYHDLLEINRTQARENRHHLDRAGVLAVNLMSSPGAGKTRLIESLVPRLEGRFRIGAIEGDLATDRDAQRLRVLGVPTCQVTTGSTCHLDAAMVHRALHQLPLQDLDLVLVENVGNLVCPGLYPLGCHLDGVLLSVTEGDDKVAKYPVVFKDADFFCLTKTDLLPHVEFDRERALTEALALRPGLRTFALSARTGEGVGAFLDYLLESLHEARSTSRAAS